MGLKCLASTRAYAKLWLSCKLHTAMTRFQCHTQSRTVFKALRQTLKTFGTPLGKLLNLVSDPPSLPSHMSNDQVAIFQPGGGVEQETLHSLRFRSELPQAGTKFRFHMALGSPAGSRRPHETCRSADSTRLASKSFCLRS